MRIVYLARRPIPSRNANSVQIVRMCEAFAKLGHQVRLLAHRGDDAPETVFGRYGLDRDFAIDVFPKRGSRLRRWRFVLHMLRTVSRRDVDLFYGRDITSLAAVAYLGKPLIYEAHSFPRPGTFRWRTLRWLLSRKNFSHLVCVTSTLADLHRQHFPALAESKIIVAPNAGAEASCDGDALDWPARPGRVQVGFVGRPFPGKGIELIVGAARQLGDCDFHVVGASRDELGWIDGEIPSNIHFHGYQPHSAIGSYYQRFDIAVAPYGAAVMNASGKESAAITSPLKLLEYMAAGLPSIVSDLPGVRDLVDSEEFALLVPPGELGAFVAALKRLAADPALRSRMGEAARCRYLDQRTTEARARRVLEPLAA